MGLVNKPHTFFGNTPAIADEVNANFDVLFNLVNGNLDAANLKQVELNQDLNPTGNTANIYTALSWLASMIHKMNGQVLWRDTPLTTLKALSEHVAATENVHGVDSSGFESKSGAQAKADAAKSAAVDEAKQYTDNAVDEAKQYTDN